MEERWEFVGSLRALVPVDVTRHLSRTVAEKRLSGGGPGKQTVVTWPLDHLWFLSFLLVSLGLVPETP